MVGLLKHSFICMQDLWNPARVITEFSATSPTKTLFPPEIVQFGPRNSSQMCFGGSKRPPFRKMETSVLLRTFNKERMFL